MVLALMLGTASWAHAQGVTTATIRGQVVDESGEPLPGANVVALHVPTGSQYGTATSANGRFVLPSVRVGGPYIIEASFVGYQSQRLEGIQLDLGESRRFTLRLKEQTAQLAEVQITADEGGVFNKERTGISTNISGDEIDNAASLDRSLADFVRLTPQSTTINTGDDGTAFSLAGQNNRYNTIFIDGAVSNDVFGLAETGVDGGQTGASPISIDAIKQFEIDISPFDVTQSFFGGGAINAITRSGSNQFKGSFAYERREESFVENLPDGPFPTFTNNRYVGWASGPIIEDKLFFFVNADILRSSTPAPFTAEFANDNDAVGTYRGSVINSAAEVNNFLGFLDQTLGFSPGGFRTKDSVLDSNKLLGKLDWNVNQNHRITLRYSYTQSDNVEVDGSDSGELVFNSRNEVFPNTTQIGALEWNGTFGTRVSNKLILSYKKVEDDRDTNLSQPFPTISITDGAGAIEIGGEPFSTVNFLSQDVATLTNNTNIFLGDHTLTFGTHNEWYDLNNQFIPFNYGWYFFDSVDQFRQSACAAANNPGSISGCAPYDADPNAAGYQRPQPANSFLLRAFSLVDDNPNTPGFEETVGDATSFAGQFNALLSGVYAQDEWQVNDRLRLTYGLRVDFPFILDDPPYANPEDPLVPNNSLLNPRNTTLPTIANYYDLQGAQAGEAPNATPHWAPRFGFNWDVYGDQRTQVRGGIGVFTSRQPFVWYGGMFLNNGVLSGQVSNFGQNPLDTDLSDGGLTVEDPCCGGRAPSEIIPSGRLELFEDEYKLPRFLRYSLGLDQQLPGGWVGTFEGQYTNTLSNVLVTNVNLLPANARLNGPDNRPVWVPEMYNNGDVGPFSEGVRIDNRYTAVHRVGNTDRGYSYNLTAQLRNTYEDVFGTDNAMRVNASYTYGDSYVINEGTSSQINSLWDGMENVNGANNLELSRSDFSVGHRILVRTDYRQAFGENLAATIGLTYVGQSGRPLSYIIDNSEDMVRSSIDESVSLFYVPRTASAFNFQPTTINGVTITPQQQAAALDQFIQANDYLNRHRGEYTDRNADRTPFEGVVDLNFKLEVAGDLVGRTQSLEITADIFNFSSMLGDIFGTDWGERFQTPSSFSPVQFEGFVDPPGDGNGTMDLTPVYTAEVVQVADTNGDGTPDAFNGAISQDALFDKLRTGSTYSSQWQMRLGVRYTF